MARLFSMASTAGALSLMAACSEGPARFAPDTDAATDVLVPRVDAARDVTPDVIAPVDRPAVRTVRTVITTGTPMEAPTRFGGAEATARAPTWVYPDDRTIVPPNLPGFEVHFMPGEGNTLFEVTFSGDVVDVKVYATCTMVNGGCVLPIPREGFDQIAAAGRSGGGVRMVIRGTGMGSTSGPVSRSESRFLGLTQTDLRGGVYYWAATVVGRVDRFDFAREDARPEVFLQGANPFVCVGCHVLSRDGTRMAAGYSFPAPAQTQIIDVATRMQRGSNVGSNFGSFSPDNTRYISSDGNALALFSGDTATAMPGLAPGTTGSQPDWSPNGDQVVFSRARQGIPIPLGNPGHGAPSDLFLMRWNVTTFGPPRMLVQSMGENNYYPGFSPNGQWVVFNRSSMTSYNAPDAALWAVRGDAMGAPVSLTAANGPPGVNNSWPKWTPFVERYVGELEEPLMWVTFSSNRDYGLRLRQGSTRRAQLWMAAFRPSAAATDPSAPAFWLPFQNIEESNHIAQWVETVRRNDCTMDRNCPAGETCVRGQCVGAPP